MCYRDPRAEATPGRWETREKAKARYPVCIFARLILYSLTVAAISTFPGIRWAVAAISGLFLLWVLRNYCQDDPKVWWYRPPLMVFLALVGIVQLWEDGEVRWQASMILFGMHLMFSIHVCCSWYSKAGGWRQVYG